MEYAVRIIGQFSEAQLAHLLNEMAGDRWQVDKMISHRDIIIVFKREKN